MNKWKKYLNGQWIDAWPSGLRQALGLLVTLATMGLLEILALGGSPVALPMRFFVPALAISTYVGGLWWGLLSAVLAVLYCDMRWRGFEVAEDLFNFRSVRISIMVFFSISLVLIVDLLRRVSSHSVQKVREQESKQSSQRLENLVQGLDAVIWEGDPNTWEFFFISRHIEQMLGYEAKYFIDGGGPFFSSLIHPDDRERVLKQRREGSQCDQVHDLEFRMIRADGTVVVVRTLARVQCDKDGKPNRTYGIFVDITRRYEAESRLAAEHAVTHVLSRAQSLEEAVGDILKALCKQLPAALGQWWQLDQTQDQLVCEQLHQTNATPTMQAYIQHCQTISLGRGDGLAGRVWEERRPCCMSMHAEKDQTLQQLATAANLHSGIAMPVMMGESFHGVLMFLSSQPLGSESELMRMMGAISSEISQFILRNSAEGQVVQLNQDLQRRINENQKVMDVLPLGMAVAHDASCRHITINPHLARMLETGLDANISQDSSNPFPLNVRILRNGKPVPRAQLPMMLAVTTGKSVRDYECQLELPSGETVEMLIQVEPLFDEQGQVRGCVAAHVDITQHKRFEAQLRSLNQTLEKRVAERSQVAEQRTMQVRALSLELTRVEQRERRHLAQILHDHLQQVLVAAKMRVDLLELISKEQRTLHIAARLTDLLEQSIEITRSLSVQLSPPMLYEVGLSAALQWLAGRMLEQYGLRVELIVKTEAQPDDDRRTILFQAARELLFNVVKHAGVKEAKLSLLPGPTDGYMQLVVEDDGKGFNPVVQQNASAGHFGLFSIVQRLEHLGGSALIVSSPGNGTRVALRSPSMSPVTETATKGSASLTADDDEAAPSGHKKKA